MTFQEMLDPANEAAYLEEHAKRNAVMKRYAVKRLAEMRAGVQS